jgi:RND family efflux transporter MFP subunit
LIAELSDGGLKDQLDQMKLQLKLARTTYERQKRLWDKKIGSEIQFLQTKTQYLSLKKGVSQMNDQVAKTKIVAPFSGIIDHIIADTGSNLIPGSTPIIRIINLDQMKAIAEIPEIHLPNIKKDSAVEVSIPVLGTQIKEKISAVGNFINPNNRSFRIEISLNNKKGALKPNMSVEIKINDYSNSEAILVPVKDILENQKGESYVYKLQVEDQVQNTFKAIKTFVKLGKSSNNMVEILEGLEAGDRIIEDGIRLIKDQQLVKNI